MARRSLDTTTTVAALHWICNYPEDSRISEYFREGEFVDADFGSAARQILGVECNLHEFVDYSVQMLVRTAEKQLGMIPS